MAVRERSLGQDEVSIIVSYIDVMDDLASAAAVSVLWRSEVLPKLIHARGLRPADGANVIANGGRLKIKEPTFVIMLPDGDLAISESSLHRVLIFAPDGRRRRTMGSFGYASREEDLAMGKPLALNYPKGLVASCDGRYLYIADRNNHRVLKTLLSDGTVVAQAGGRGMGIQRGHFKFPEGLALATSAAHGATLFVSDFGNDRVVVLDAETLAWRHELKDEVRLALPAGLAASRTELFVVDASNFMVHVFDLEEACGAVQGVSCLRSLGCRGTDPGELEFPWGVAADPNCDRILIGEGAASGGRYGRVQVLCAQTGASLQVVTLPGQSRVSGLWTDGRHVLAVDHDCRAIRMMTTVWPARGSTTATPPVPAVAAATVEHAIVGIDATSSGLEPRLEGCGEEARRREGSSSSAAPAGAAVATGDWSDRGGTGLGVRRGGLRAGGFEDVVIRQKIG